MLYGAGLRNNLGEHMFKKITCLGVVLISFGAFAATPNSVVKRLLSNDITIQDAAIEDVKKMNSDEKKAVVAEVVNVLQGCDDAGARRSAQVFMALENETDLPFDALEAAILGNNDRFRRNSTFSLTIIQHVPSKIVDALIKALGRSDDKFCDWEHADHIPDVRNCSSAAEALAYISPVDKSIVARLSVVLDNGDKTSKGNAAFALGMIGPEAATVVPQLEKINTEKSIWLKSNVDFALERIKVKQE